jgi:hypothetical protein
MTLLVPPICCCIRSSVNGKVYALCARCRARRDPRFALRCVEPEVEDLRRAKRGGSRRRKNK